MSKAKATTKFFELIIGSDKGEIHSGDIPVRWCVSNGLLEDLEKKGLKNIHVLFVPLNPNGIETKTRKLVPISDLMTYVRFTRPGKCRLFAFLVHEPGGDGRVLKKIFTKKFAGHYDSDIIDSDGEYRREHHGERSKSYIYERHAETDIELPEGVFGKQPSPGIRWFTNLWHSEELEDQCHFRRRFAFALFIKSWAVLGFALGIFLFRGFIGSLVFAAGFTKINWKVVGHPFSRRTNELLINVNSEDNFFLNIFKINRKKENYYDPDPVGEISSMSGLFLSPLFITLYLLAGVITVINGGSFWTAIGVILVLLLILFGIMGGMIGVFLLIEKSRRAEGIMDWFHRLARTYVEWLVAREIQANQLKDIPELICPKNKDNVIQANFSDIPFKRRSIRLWVEAIKNSVCKPMAR